MTSRRLAGMLPCYIRAVRLAKRSTSTLAYIAVLTGSTTACAGSPAAAAPASAAATPASASSVESLLEAARTKIEGGRTDEARNLIGRARASAGHDWSGQNRVAYMEATLHSYAHDFEAAASALVKRLPAVAERISEPTEFEFHNHLIMLRAAQGDLASALVECDAMLAAGQRGTFAVKDRERMTQVRLKDHWHRAYLLRAYAVTVDGSRRAAALQYANEAREAYRVLAKKVGGFDDSIAVLDAFFAVHDGSPAAALEAARRVDPAKNGDIEDLYYVQMGLAFGGDSAGAARVVEQMRHIGYVSHANPIFLMWVDRDREGKRFTPRHPTAATP